MIINNGIAPRILVRLVGIMAFGVGVAWAVQVLGLGGSTAFGRLMWVVCAATIAGAGADLVFTSASTNEEAVKA